MGMPSGHRSEVAQSMLMTKSPNGLLLPSASRASVCSREHFVEVNSRSTSGGFEPFLMTRGKAWLLNEFTNCFV